MNGPARTWQLHRTAPVREDAESLFVPRSDLPDADVGDTVDADGRRGTLTATDDRDGEPFFLLTFDA